MTTYTKTQKLTFSESLKQRMKTLAPVIFILAIGIGAYLIFTNINKEEPDTYASNPAIVIKAMSSQSSFFPTITFSENFSFVNPPEELELVRPSINSEYSVSDELASKLAMKLGLKDKIGSGTSYAYYSDVMSLNYIDEPKMLEISKSSELSGAKRNFPTEFEAKKIIEDYFKQNYGFSDEQISNFGSEFYYLTEDETEFRYSNQDEASTMEINYFKLANNFPVKQEFGNGVIRVLISKGWEIRKVNYSYYDYEVGEIKYPSKSLETARSQLKENNFVLKSQYGVGEGEVFTSVQIDSLEIYYYNDTANEWLIPVYSFRGKSNTNLNVELIVPAIEDRFIRVAE